MASDHAGPTEALTIVQRCQTIIASHLHAAVSVLDTDLQTLAQLHQQLRQLPTYASDLEQARHICDLFHAVRRHRGLEVAGSLKLSEAEAQDCRQALEGSLSDLEAAQTALRAFLLPVAHAAYADEMAVLIRDAGSRREERARNATGVNSIFAQAAERRGDLSDVLHRQAVAARRAAGLVSTAEPAFDAAAPSGDGHELATHELRDGTGADVRAAASRKVDEVMRVTETALLVARLLGRHVSSMLAVVYDLDVAVHPSRQHLVGSRVTKLREKPRLVHTRQSVVDLLGRVSSDVWGFSVEKYGACPDILVGGDEGLAACMLPEYVEYVLTEAAKNAVASLIDAHGEWDLDDAPPITMSAALVPQPSAGEHGDCCGRQIDGGVDGPPLRAPERRKSAGPLPAASLLELEHGGGWGGSARHLHVWEPPGAAGQQRATPGGADDQEHGLVAAAHDDAEMANPEQYLSVTIADRGPGMSAALRQNAQHFFYTSQAPRAATYGYSRAHGSQFAGLGVGMPMIKLITEFMGGSVDWQSSDDGTTVTFTFPVNGFAIALPGTRSS